MKKSILILLLLTLALTACEKAPEVNPAVYGCTLTTPDQNELHPNNAVFQAELNKVGTVTPGVQVALRSADNFTWTGVSGWADLHEGVALEPCHQFMVGSVSKIMTGVLIMQLQDENILSVNDSLSRWLPESLIGEIENADKVTLVDLLHHTSGIRDYLGVEQFINAMNTPNFLESQEDKLAYIYGKSAEFEPGAEYGYSNTNYVLLGLVIERARGLTLWDAVDQYIAMPLNLETMEMGTHLQPVPEGVARPYLADYGDSYFDIMQHAVSDAATGDGGIASNMQDLNIFIEALFDGQLISDSALIQMKEMNVVQEAGEASYGWPDERYGLGLEIYNTPYGTGYGHTGGTSTYSTYLLHFPEEGATLAITYNGAAYQGNAEELKSEMFDRLLELLFE